MVTVMEEWPRWCWTALGLASAAASKLAQVCLRSWLCRCRHNHDYADLRVMPISV
jgi:hypothetical protein